MTPKQRLLAEREYITVIEFAELTGLRVTTLYNWSSAGIGPVVHKMGGRNRYRAVEVEEWFRGLKRAS
jgi:predicted DNA-binding transcriptional regulator AlpA